MYQKLSPLAQQNFQAMGEDLVIEIVWHGDPQMDKAEIAGRNVLGLGVVSGASVRLSDNGSSRSTTRVSRGPVGWGR
jgi:hypothetical protein